MLEATFHVLSCFLESCLDLFVTAVGLSGAPMLICACVLHVVCLSIFLVVGLDLEAPHWLALGVACFVLVSQRPRTRLPDTLTPSGARTTYILRLGSILIACFGTGAPC